MASTLSGASTEKHSSRSKFYITRKYEATSLLCLIAWIFLIVSFAAPYWLSSFTKAYASFVRLGLWDVCFNNYRHPPYQYDEKFDGCNWIYSAKYQNIREWLQPGNNLILHSSHSSSFLCIYAWMKTNQSKRRQNRKDNSKP